MGFTVFCPYKLVRVMYFEPSVYCCFYVVNSFQPAVFQMLLHASSAEAIISGRPKLTTMFGSTEHCLLWSGDRITRLTVRYIFVPTPRTGQKHNESCNKRLRRNNLVSIRNRLRHKQSGVRISAGARDSSLPQKRRPLWDPLSLLFIASRLLFPWE